MRAFSSWLVLGVLWVPIAVACGSKGKGLSGEGADDASVNNGDDASGSSSGVSSSGGPDNPMGTFTNSEAGVMVAASDCKAGFYHGNFTGSYSSGFILGIPLDVHGDVELTLNQAGGADMMCEVRGEGFVSCANVFTLSGGTITGVANPLIQTDAGTIGGYPYYCTMTGTLDCAKKQLLNGWIQCLYCVGTLADGGTVCNGLGGNFAGPLTAGYDTGSHAFTNGTWNGAESLCPNKVCNDGTMPGPDGGSISDYLALDGGYGFLGKFGGSGDWNATLQK
jgi:hypothetical protein